jgi:Holliday junction resolvasome RuvABC ATP-dependent DNA helicase subunit
MERKAKLMALKITEKMGLDSEDKEEQMMTVLFDALRTYPQGIEKLSSIVLTESEDYLP